MKKCVKVGILSPYLSKEQFCKQCNISGGTALKLIKSGLIPVIKGPTGYLIAKADIEQYLINRERDPKTYHYRGTHSGQHRGDLTAKGFCAIKRYFQDKPDILSTNEVAKLFGCHVHTVRRWEQDFQLATVRLQHKTYIPKQALLDFLVSPHLKKLIPGDTELWELINLGRTRRR